MSDQVSPRVNSARLPDYNGRIVRVAGQIIRVRLTKTSLTQLYANGIDGMQVDNASNEAVIQASDGGQIRVLLSGVPLCSAFAGPAQLTGRWTFS